ncbi:hypothetical protein P9X10_02765 [Bacillus cereus]|nr:hypothetical protein [Bacillus cereus]
MCGLNKCIVSSCNGKLSEDGFCKRHLKLREEGELYCTVSDCNGYVRTKDLCKRHEDQRKKFGRVYTEKEFKEIKPTLFCREDNCLNRSTGKGYCDEHKPKKKIGRSWCKKSNCRKFDVLEGLCPKHYMEEFGVPNMESVTTPYDKLEDKAGTRCNIINCNELKEIGEYCSRHAILIQTDKLDEAMERIGLEKCKAEGCNSWAKTEGLCGHHRHLFLVYGKVVTLKEHKEISPSSFCHKDDCLERTYKEGYCKDHYTEYRKTVRKVVRNKACKIEGCQSSYIHEGYCPKHYVEKYGIPNMEGVTTKYDRGNGRTGMLTDSCHIKHCNRQSETGNYCLKHAILIKEDMLQEDMERRGHVKCYAEGCNEIAKTKGLCVTHIDIKKKYGRILSRQERKEISSSYFCRVDGCLEKKVDSKHCEKHIHIVEEKHRCCVDKCKGNIVAYGLCTNHYIEKFGEPDLEGVTTPYDKLNDRTGTRCRIVYCSHEQTIEGYCDKHAILIQEGKLEEEMIKAGKTECKADGCQTIAKSDGLCPRHKRVLKEHGRLLSVEEDKRLYPKSFCQVDGCYNREAYKHHCKEHQHLVKKEEEWFIC